MSLAMVCEMRFADTLSIIFGNSPKISMMIS
jgi:hypothetical protein